MDQTALNTMKSLLVDIQFAQPLILWLLPVSLLLMFIGLRMLTRKLHHWSAIYSSPQQHYYRHPMLPLLLKMNKFDQTTARSSLIQNTLVYTVLLLLLHLSLAQPYRLGEKFPDPPEYRDIIFIVDTSVNMMLRDYLVEGKRTDRMSMVKSVLQHFIKGLPGSRLGLVVFSEQPYTLVPLTTDHALLQYQLQRLQPASLTGRRTDPGKALLTLSNELAPQLREGLSPALVLLTDASRPVREIDPRTAAALIKQQGLHLHTIAIGAGSEAAREKGTSTLIYQPANFTLLEEIASAGGGESFWADSHAALSQVLEKIQTTEKTHIKPEPVFIKQPLYFWPLGCALFWILLWQLLPLLRVAA